MSELEVIYNAEKLIEQADRLINEKNIEKFNEIKNLSGYLIGASSINPDKFIKIINKV